MPEEDRSIDDEALRRRFPWVGLVDDDRWDVASRYREILSDALFNRRVVEVVDAVERAA